MKAMSIFQSFLAIHGMPKIELKTFKIDTKTERNRPSRIKNLDLIDQIDSGRKK